MNCVQVTVYLGIIDFLINGLEREQAEKFGIREMTEDLTKVTYIAYDSYVVRTEWDELRDGVIARYCELKPLVNDMGPMLEGCCDICDGEGNCKPRGENKEIWEL